MMLRYVRRHLATRRSTKALIYGAPGETEVQEVPDPVIQEPTDAIVQVIATSICGSDLHVVSGELVPDTGFILGHEMVGRIRELGPAVKNFSIGDRVTVSSAPYCCVCASCRGGNYAHCEFGGVYGSGETYGGFAGSHAERLRIPFAARGNDSGTRTRVRRVRTRDLRRTHHWSRRRH